MASALDRNDIQLGFESLDIHVNGFLSMEDIYTLFMGLGYCSCSETTYVSVVELRNTAGRDALDLQETMELFGKFQRFDNGEHCRSHWQSVYAAAVVGGGSNHLTASHIQTLCRRYGKESIDMTCAHRIVLSIRASTKDGRINRLKPLDEHDLQQVITEEDFLAIVNNS